MVFQSKHISGIGRGKEIGFPTMNLAVVEDIILEDGIYAAWIMINDKPYKGALHYGPIPTFNQKDNTMEVHLIDVTDEDFPETKDVKIEIDIVQKLRDIKRFLDPADLTEQIARDVDYVSALLK